MLVTRQAVGNPIPVLAHVFLRGCDGAAEFRTPRHCLAVTLPKMAAVLDEVGKSAEKLVDEEKVDEIVDGEDKTGAAEASKKKKKKKKKKKAGAFCSSVVLK